jgi:3-phenylpropionate/trans-cinnamate dioxygenase ferredoxin reductase subunit
VAVDRFDVLIVGAGHAGAQAAAALRQRKFTGTIGLFGAEPHLPYERPPLSKEYLAGERPFERMLLKPPAFWQEQSIALRPASQVVAVDPVSRQVTTTDGGAARYGVLIWAAGGHARRLSCVGADLAGVHAVRTRSDVDDLKLELRERRRVVIVGGGYIGLETAAVLSKLGHEIVVLEAMDRVLPRVAGPPISRFLEAEHRAHGVDIRTGVRLARVEGSGGRLSGVRLADGSLIECDLIIAGIGIVPSVEPLIEAGANGGDGVDIDAYCRTSLPAVFAIGDCAAHENPHAGGERLRLESVQNANDQATTAARAIVGDLAPYTATPWFWSNQYDIRLQTVGLARGYDQVVVRGEPSAQGFSVGYLKAGQLLAIDCVNAVKDYAQGRALVASACQVDARRFSDPAVPLKALGLQAAS